MSMLPADIHRRLEQPIPQGPRYQGQAVVRVDRSHSVTHFRGEFQAVLADRSVAQLDEAEYMALAHYFPDQHVRAFRY